MLTSPKWKGVGASLALNESPRLPDISIRESKPIHQIRHQPSSFTFNNEISEQKHNQLFVLN